MFCSKHWDIFPSLLTLGLVTLVHCVTCAATQRQSVCVVSDVEQAQDAQDAANPACHSAAQSHIDKSIGVFWGCGLGFLVCVCDLVVTIQQLLMHAGPVSMLPVQV